MGDETEEEVEEAERWNESGKRRWSSGGGGVLGLTNEIIIGPDARAAPRPATVPGYIFGLVLVEAVQKALRWPLPLAIPVPLAATVPLPQYSHPLPFIPPLAAPIPLPRAIIPFPSQAAAPSPHPVQRQPV